MAYQDDISEALAHMAAQREDLARWRNYYHGRHDTAFATDKWKSTFACMFRNLSLNLCRGVVNALSDRLELTGFSVEAGQEAAGEAAWDIWNRNRMDLRAGKVHNESAQTGDSYVIVWPGRDDTLARIHPNGPETMHVCYDEEDATRVLWASKIWSVANTEGDKKGRLYRANLYYPERIEKYVTRGAVSRIPNDADDFFEYSDEPAIANPYGIVPVFHFPNNECGCTGESELVDVVPLQDALNKSVADMLIAMEFEAFAQRWAVGVEGEVDPLTLQEKPAFRAGVDRIFQTSNDLAKFGEFSRADLTNFLAVKQDFKLDIAQVSGTPLHYLSLMNDPPSGEALKTLEARFTKKCKDRQTAWGNAWEDALSLALRIDHGGSEGVLLSAEWVDPAPKSEREAAETQTLKQRAGVSKRQSLREMGYTDALIEEMLSENQEETDRAAELAMRSFDAGEME